MCLYSHASDPLYYLTFWFPFFYFYFKFLVLLSTLIMIIFSLSDRMRNDLLHKKLVNIHSWDEFDVLNMGSSITCQDVSFWVSNFRVFLWKFRDLDSWCLIRNFFPITLNSKCIWLKLKHVMCGWVYNITISSLPPYSSGMFQFQCYWNLYLSALLYSCFGIL